MSRGTWLPASPERDDPALDDRDATADPWWTLAGALHAFDVWDGNLTDRADVIRDLVNAAHDVVDVVWEQDRRAEEADTPPGTIAPAPIGDELAAKYGWIPPLQRFLNAMELPRASAQEVLG